MIHSSDVSGRRILTCQAVHPCEAITGSTLLNSTISLAFQIGAHGTNSTFTSNKRNIRNSIRLVQVLLIFFQELRESGTDLGATIKLALSELHLVFQKLRFLLEDCARGDVRVWMLMNSSFVANKLRVLMRELAVPMEVFPMDSIGVSDEAKECVDFVIGQARGLKFDVEPDDTMGSNLVASLLDRFEEKVIPDPDDIRWVLEYLGIRKWSECNREIWFLEEEIGSDKSSSSEAAHALAGGLMGFMIYSRCVLFDSVDNNTIIEDRAVDSEGSGGSPMLSRLRSVDLRCPISLEIMADAVTISTGHTFDRACIQKWFEGGNPICPKTGERLVSIDLVPNFALQRLIAQYCIENDIPNPLPKPRPAADCDNNVMRRASSAAEEALRMAADFLVIKLATGASHEKYKAACEIRLLTKKSIFHRACVVESGATPHLLNLISSRDPMMQESATAALLNLSKHPRAKSAIVENGGLPLILNVLQGGQRMEARQHSAAVLFYLSSVEEYRGMIGTTQRMIPALVELIRGGNDRGKKNALVAVFGLLLDPMNHHRVLHAELVPLLVSLLGSLEKEELVIDSLAVLSALGERPGGAMAILCSEALGPIVGILCSSSSSVSRFGKEHCVSLLHALCTIGGRAVVQVLVHDHSLMVTLYSLLTEGTSRARKKASALIRIFHEFSEESSSPSMMGHRGREPFIHVR
ncbi:hypothetical protein Dimus_015072 [Dionaea muscipula]